MRWGVPSDGIYICLHLDAQAFVDDLRDLIGRKGEAVSKSVAFCVHSKRHLAVV